MALKICAGISGTGLVKTPTAMKDRRNQSDSAMHSFNCLFFHGHIIPAVESFILTANHHRSIFSFGGKDSAYITRIIEWSEYLHFLTGVLTRVGCFPS